MELSDQNVNLTDQGYRTIFENICDGIILSDLKTGLIVDANPAACLSHGYPREELIGMKLAILIDPSRQKEFKTLIHDIRPDSELHARMQHTRKDGSTLVVDWRGTAFPYRGKAYFLGIMRDVSEQVRLEGLLHKRVETRTHEQEMLLEISQTLASTLEFQPGMILDQLRTIIEYTRAGLFAVSDSTLIAMAMRGTVQLERSPPINLHLEGPEILTGLFKSFRPIRVANLRNENPQTVFLRSLLDDGAKQLLDGMFSWMWVPLAVKSRIIGCIGVAHEEADYFTPHHADLALSVANQAAITMVNAELYEQAQELATMEERQRLARNLHDAINQSLFSAGLIAEVLPRIWYQDQDLVLQSLKDLRKLTRSAQDEMRTLLAELRPKTLTDSNLDDLLRLLGNVLSGRIEAPVMINVPENVILPAKVQIAFYRICQEALNNIAKHANAKQVEIHLEQKADLIELRIRDDGQGFDQTELASGHYGLNMMEERSSAIGAQLTITSQPGHGTELILHWNNPSNKEGI
jgi:PAS domain S-box-containing protein